MQPRKDSASKGDKEELLWAGSFPRFCSVSLGLSTLFTVCVC